MKNFANHIGYSDINPFEVVRAVSKTTLEIRAMNAERDTSVKLDFQPGGFFAHCSNQNEQRWILLLTKKLEYFVSVSAKRRTDGRIVSVIDIILPTNLLNFMTIISKLYFKIDDILSKDACELLAGALLLCEQQADPNGAEFHDTQVMGAYARYGYSGTDSLKYYLLPKMEQLTGKRLIPTYLYSRKYRNGHNCSDM